MADYNRYQRFQRRQDNVNQVVSARDVNELQGTLENVQQQVIGVKDNDFLQKALFTLDHNPLVNAMWVDLMEDTAKVDIGASQNTYYSIEERGWSFASNSPALVGFVYSKPYQVTTRSEIRSFLLMVNAYVPPGSRIIYEVSADGTHWHLIEPSRDNVLGIPSWSGYTLRLRARLERDSAESQPILYGWALLYHDPRVGVLEIDPGTIITPPTDGEDPLQPIRHSDLLEIGKDDHHPQEHAHDGMDGSGRVSHTSLLDVGEDDHHPKDHRHGQDGVSPVNLSEDVVGTLPFLSHSLLLQTGLPGQLSIERNAEGHASRVVAPDSETHLTYDVEGRLGVVTTVFTVGPAAGCTAITTLDYSTTPPRLNTVVKDAQGVDIPVP